MMHWLKTLSHPQTSQISPRALPGGLCFDAQSADKSVTPIYTMPLVDRYFLPLTN